MTWQKLFFRDEKSAAALDYDRNPQKEKMQRYAESFQKLANSFYGLPGRKDYLSSSEIKDLIEESREGVCRRCHLSQVCWIQHYPQTYQRFYSLLRIMEENDEEKLRKARADLTGVCISQESWSRNCRGSWTENARTLYGAINCWRTEWLWLSSWEKWPS